MKCNICEACEVLKDTAIKLWPYFKPSLKNLMRTTALVSAYVLPIVSNVVVNKAFLIHNNTNTTEPDNSPTDFNVMMSLASVATLASFTAAQYAISTFLTTSTMQAMKEDHVKLLMDEESKFLLHGDIRGMSSLQYPTVGLGTTVFAGNAITLLVGLPMHTISSFTSLVNIATVTNVTTSAATFAFIGGSVTATFAFVKAYMFYQQHNQEIENKLVGKVGFIEAHREAITLMRALDPEHIALLQELNRVTSTIPKLTILDFSHSAVVAMATSIASQFLGGYYKSDFIPSLDNPNAKVLNVMVALLMSSMVKVAVIMTSNYTYVKLNLKEMKALEKAFNDCLLVRKANNKMQYTFSGDQLSMKDFCVYKAHSNSIETDYDCMETLELRAMFDNLNVNLELNKIYKLSGKSGYGKTTLLKAITNNWQYTEGIVNWPINAKNNIYFIPQHSFIPTGTLIEVLTYPFKLEELLKNYFAREDNPYTNNEDETTLLMDYSSNASPTEQYFLNQMNQPSRANKDEQYLKYMPVLVRKVKHLLKEVKLLPNVIKENEIESEDIRWGERLSGGEVQKIGIIRGLLTNCHFIIMDEATSALDPENRETVYQVIKKHTSKLENYMIIYTEHGSTPNFADVVLEINEQNLRISAQDNSKVMLLGTIEVDSDSGSM